MSKYELKDFKVGNRAKVIDPSGDSRARLGEIGTITDTNWAAEDIVRIKTEDGRMISMFYYRFIPIENEWDA